MNYKVRTYLIEKARKKQLAYYQSLSDDCHLGLDMQNNPHDRLLIGSIIGEISVFEHQNDRPLLSALVVTRGEQYQGDGFFKLAEELGFGKWDKLKKDISFEIGQINACYDFWGNPAKYDKYKNVQEYE